MCVFLLFILQMLTAYTFSIPFPAETRIVQKGRSDIDLICSFDAVIVYYQQCRRFQSVDIVLLFKIRMQKQKNM